MPATKIKSLYILPLAVKISGSSAVKNCSIRRSQFQGQMWDPAQNHQKNKSSEHFETTWFLLLSTRFISFLLTRISRGPSQHKKWILRQQVRVRTTQRVPIPFNIPKHRTKITCQCTNPFRHLARATPETTRKPFRGHGRLCRPRPPWPLQRSAARPRRHGPSRAAYIQRRPASGAEDATRKAGRLRLPWRNKAYSQWDVSGPGGWAKKSWMWSYR